MLRTQSQELTGGVIMYDPQTDKIIKMITDTVNRYNGQFHSVALDWEVISMSHPRYESKVEQLVPLLVIDWK